MSGFSFDKGGLSGNFTALSQKDESFFQMDLGAALVGVGDRDAVVSNVVPAGVDYSAGLMALQDGKAVEGGAKVVHHFGGFGRSM